MSDARKRLNHLMVTNNIVRRMNAEMLERIDRRDAEIELAQLADIGVGDAGPLNNGINIRGDGITINASTSPATFTGTGEVECWPAIEVYSGVYAVNFLLKSGVVTYYKSTDGSWYAGAGAVKIDNDGIRLINVDDVSRFILNDPFITNAGGDIGAIEQGGGDRLTIDYQPYGNTELLSNAGFEAGALTNWTAAGAGTWSAQTTTVYRGTYAARCLLSGTSVHTLTSDRIVLSSNDLAMLVFYRYDTLVGWTEKTAYIKWYDATSGGNLLQTDSVDLGNAGANSWRYKFLRAAGPADALSCEVVLSATTSSGTPSVYFDALRLRASGGGGSLDIRGTLQGAIPNGPYAVSAPPANSFFGPDVLPYWVAPSAQTLPLHMGVHAGYSLIASASVTPTTAFSETINASALGPNGFFNARGRLRVRTVGATSVGVTLDFIFGGTTLFTYASTLTGATNDRTIPIDFDFTLTNQNDAAIQVASLFIADKIATAGGSTAIGANAFDGSGENRATEDTDVGNKTFSILATLTTATNSRFEREFVSLLGPFHIPARE